MDNLKEKMHEINKHRYIHGGDIWWYAADENIGTEINGKSKRFSRPVLILKKYWHYSFRGVPMASQEHKGNWYDELIFREKNSPQLSN